MATSSKGGPSRPKANRRCAPPDLGGTGDALAKLAAAGTTLRVGVLVLVASAGYFADSVAWVVARCWVALPAMEA